MLRICAVFVLICLPFPALADFSGPIRVIDADTWDVGGERVRLFGIDAPERDQTCETKQGQTWACGDWATDQARARYSGHTATCERITTDRYGRTVARCLSDGRDVARDMVADGLAFAYRRYSMDYDLEEKGAAVNARGLHASVVQSPSDYRAGRVATSSASRPASPDCAIKGNISRRGERIYHMPGQRDYEATKISASKGERWFCSENEARASGWRPALR